MTDGDVDILLVEGDPTEQLLALRAFAEHQLADKVHVAQDGTEALDFLFCTGAYAARCHATPLVILLGKTMSWLEGMEMLALIRANARTRTIPVVMLSLAEGRDLIESYELGVSTYVVKQADFGTQQGAKHLHPPHAKRLNENRSSIPFSQSNDG